MEEIIQIYSGVPYPPKIIRYNPRKFNYWVGWARNYNERKKQDSGKILPFGAVFDTEQEYYDFWR